MTAAFVLSINMFIAMLFAFAFGVVAKTNSTARGARWLAAAYALGVVNVGLEFILPGLSEPSLTVVAIFATYLVSMTFGVIGVSVHYRVKLPVIAVAITWVAAIALVPLILGLPYGSTLRVLLYQLPYAALQLLMTIIVLRAQRRMALENLLATISGLATFIYLLKPLLAWQYGGVADAPQGYLASNYAAISQTMGAIIVIALALTLLLIMMRDMTIEMVNRSETDLLAGIFNRRGFESHGDRMLQEAKRRGTPLTLVMIDIDRFKTINDSFGHSVGDLVIADLAALLSGAIGSEDLVARLGGEEFAILLSGKDAKEAYRIAESIRETISQQLPKRLDSVKAITASFGLAQLQPTDQLSDLCRRSDLALYDAKARGRNNVSVRFSEAAKPSSGRGRYLSSG